VRGPATVVSSLEGDQFTAPIEVDGHAGNEVLEGMDASTIIVPTKT
jgi:hypothetical protein